jgi:hypothetical protein
MKKIASIFSLILLLLVGSCSTFFPATQFIEREIANAEDAPMSVDELFSIRRGKNENDTVNYVQSIKSNAHYSSSNFVFIEDPNLPEDTVYKLDPTILDEKYTIRIFYSPAAIKDVDAAAELQKWITCITGTSLVSPHSTFELAYNARQGHIPSLHILAKIRSQLERPNPVDDWKEILEGFAKLERKENKSRKALETTRKAVMDLLDKAPEAEQFRVMVARNDRKGVVKVLRAYLPWEQMAPFEKKFWENHLSVMADPLPLEERIFIYRGIDDDMIQVAVDEGAELSKEEAIREQKIFLMSTMMTKNQGTWNRRLRSLTAMYDKFMGLDFQGSSELTPGYRITTLFTNHSRDPKGSPYLSFTPKFTVANNFGSKRNTMFLLDPRSSYFNYASKYTNEVEFLLPLVTFPDELGAVYDRTIHANVDSQTFLTETTQKRLIKELGKEKGEHAWAKIEANTNLFFKNVSAKNGALQGGSDFFKKNLGVEGSKLVKKIEPDTNKGCMDLVQLFW